jgi:hypothetical protein
VFRETATHVTPATAPSLSDLSTMRQSVFESVSLAVGAPSGLIRGTIAQSTGNLQETLFRHRCDALRAEVETVLTSVYHTLFGVYDDVVVIEKENEPCKDPELISRLYQSGTLDEGTAKDLVAGILRVERCGLHADGGDNTVVGPLALSSPRPSLAPSESGE